MCDAAAQVSALQALGPDYQSTFSTLETDAALEQVPAAAALVTDGRESLESRLLLSYNAQVPALDICHVGSTQLLQICPSNEQWKKGALQADPAAGDPVLVQSCDLCSSPHTLAWHHSSMGRLLPACSGSAMQ